MKYVSWFLSFIVAIVLVIIGANLIKKQFKNLSQPNTTENVAKIEEYLKDNTKLRYKIIGPIVAEEKHQEVIMEISAAYRSLKIINGYNGKVVSETKLGNNSSSYEAFARALANENFTKKLSNKSDSYEGQCPQGIRYEVSIIGKDDKNSKSMWYVSCSIKFGNYAGNRTTVDNLFKRQFVDYSKITKEVVMNF